MDICESDFVKSNKNAQQETGEAHAVASTDLACPPFIVSLLLMTFFGQEVFGDKCASHSQTCDWHKRFSEDQEIVEDDGHFGRSVTSRTGHAHRGQTIKQHYYVEFLRKLGERVRKKRTYLQSNNTCILLQHNAPKHIAFSLKHFLANKRITVLGYPPHPLDLPPYDFYLFLKVKNALMETHFQSLEEVKIKASDLMRMVTPFELQHCLERWKTGMRLCIDRKGEGSTDQGEHWPSQEAFSMPNFFLLVFSNS
ncbi:histone-lysine N-methyltransferase SETMAR [Trichonephila clavipes]|uniref:Histone-lysine N-methyltransferase SETMAR n=1 Tax=Trichonephila clavipes TaxID=2585209 RepID=A0A8X6RBW8_TRICX|nr:histone-lysine N-methyltransferase SETMAR [Trichonephila clavipes]